MTARIKVYDLFPDGGRFSCQTSDYSGTLLAVAATSIRQAYALAYKDVWIDPGDERPLGIIYRYEDVAGWSNYLLWDGCRDPGGFVRPAHGKGIRAIRESITSHTCAAGAR